MTSHMMKLRSRACVLLAAMLTIAVLTSCASVSSARKESLQIYQPRVLHLRAGQTVQTPVGIYVPQTDEVWHSDAAYRALELELLNTAAALSQSRNK